MSEQTVQRSPNGVEKQTNVTASTPTQTGVVDEVVMVIERGEAQPVALGNIEKGLTALWQAAGKPRPGEAEPPVSRACVFNLVICVTGQENLPDVTETIAQITWGYPCRAIVLVRQPDDTTNQLSAAISAHCQLPTSTGKRVCCEQITIVGSGSAAEGLWSLVLPLLVPDLPVVLWWPSDPDLSSHQFARLLEVADSLMVDSRTFANPTQTFARMAEISHSEYTDTSFSDLCWARLTPWRALLAQFFDIPRYLPYLQQVDRVEIDYEAPNDDNNPNFSEALLMVGWLAKLLGWQPAFNLQRRGMDAQLILNQNGSPLTVLLHGHNHRTDELGGITQVRLVARQSLPDNTHRNATFTVSLAEDYERATLTVEEDGSPASSRSAMIARRSRTDLLCENLSVMGRDLLYEEALELAGEFSQK